MTPQDLQTLVDYNYWATHRLLIAVDALTPEQFIRDLASSFRSVRDTLTHVHDAEWIWLSRLQGSSPANRAVSRVRCLSVSRSAPVCRVRRAR